MKYFRGCQVILFEKDSRSYLTEKKKKRADRSSYPWPTEICDSPSATCFFGLTVAESEVYAKNRFINLSNKYYVYGFHLSINSFRCRYTPYTGKPITV